MPRVTVVLSTADVLSEEAILKWYADAHLSRGKSVFLEQMKKFVEWLKNAEEGEKEDGFPRCVLVLTVGVEALAADGLFSPESESDEEETD